LQNGSYYRVLHVEAAAGSAGGTPQAQAEHRQQEAALLSAARGAARVRFGSCPSVVVEAKALQGGRKNTTVVRGLNVFGVPMASLVRDCKHRFACSASVGVPVAMLNNAKGKKGKGGGPGGGKKGGGPGGGGGGGAGDDAGGGQAAALKAAAQAKAEAEAKAAAAEELLIQGDVPKEVAQLLVSEYAIPSKYVTVTVATKGNKGGKKK
jgi:translation initiation factor 1 (eIF-1/SUI1)